MTQSAWVPDASPLIQLLTNCIEKKLQVILGLYENQIHEVEIISHLGSAARPVWLCIKQSLHESECEGVGACSNVPTIASPTEKTMGAMPFSLCWEGKAISMKVFGGLRFNLPHTDTGN